MDKQLTAVEWLHLKLSTSSSEEMVGNINLWFEQAKEMEKEQMIDFARKYMLYIHKEGIITIETFYNETYGGNK
jgi:hypothetical protein